MSKLFTTILPSLVAGGLLFGSALTEAQPGPVPPTPPTPHAAPSPRPPRPPKPPKPQIHIDLGDLDELVDQQIQHALEAIADDRHIPSHVREAVKQRLEKVRVKVKKRLAKVDPKDLEQLGEELGEMGEEIGEEMEQFGKDMEKWGKQFEKQLQAQVKQKHWLKRPGVHGVVGVDTDDDDDFEALAFDDVDDLDDLDDAMKDLGDVKLDPRQRAELKKLRATTDAQVSRAKVELERASETLRTQLENGTASDQEIARSIDNVTRLESDIRKARILAWVNARRLLDDTQRKRVEAAARGRSQ